MPKGRRSVPVSPEERIQMRPALTPESREQQMIGLAMDLVEQRLLNGTASSQETTHFLKLATTKYELEKEQLRRQNELMVAKKESLESTHRVEELYKKALEAMRTYSGGNFAPADYVEDEDGER